MLRMRFILAPFLLLALLSPLFSDIKQVRVTAQRALIFAEPNRSSARLDIVEKGDILTLFQQTKVKQVWFYVTFNSPRYGSRISGFIHESAVELVTEAGAKPPVEQPPPQPAKPKEETKEPEKPPAKVEPAAKPPVKQPPPQPVKPKEETKEPEKPPAKVEPAAKPPVEQPPPQPVKPKEETKEPEKPPAKVEPAAKPPAQQLPPRRAPAGPPRKERGLLTFGLGYGSSFGGAGGLVELKLIGGLALHAGGGLYPTTLIYSETDWVKNETLYSFGLKYYFPVRSTAVSPYIDFQYGGLRVEAAQVVIGIWEYAYVYSREQKTLWGPSALVGAEVRLGPIGLTGALGVSYSLTDWEFLEQKLALAFDVGLLIHF